MKFIRRSRPTIFLAALLALAGCSTAKVRVLPGEDGVNRIVSRGIERDSAEEAAAKKADEYCEERGKTMVVVKEEKTHYSGSMDEDSRKNIRNASMAAVILSGPAGMISRRTGIGALVGGAGLAGFAMTSNRDYKAEFKFKCI